MLYLIDRAKASLQKVAFPLIGLSHLVDISSKPSTLSTNSCRLIVVFPAVCSASVLSRRIICIFPLASPQHIAHLSHAKQTCLGYVNLINSSRICITGKTSEAVNRLQNMFFIVIFITLPLPLIGRPVLRKQRSFLQLCRCLPLFLLLRRLVFPH